MVALNQMWCWVICGSLQMNAHLNGQSDSTSVSNDKLLMAVVIVAMVLSLLGYMHA
jgi:hypothetical protein